MKPYPNQDKKENYEHGLSIIIKFLLANGFPVPEIYFDPTLDCRGQFISAQNGMHKVFINLTRCKKPVSVPGFTWSFTGHKSDITPSGVLAHEIAHYVDWRNQWLLSRRFSWDLTKEVSSYEPNKEEAFAETMRLFIINPDLLRLGSPERYEYIVNKLGLKPVVEDDWRIVLSGAHEKVLSAAQSWINKPNKYK